MPNIVAAHWHIATDIFDYLRIQKMKMHSSKQHMTAIAGMALVGSMMLPTSSQADTNPFALTELDTGYMQIAMEEGKCGGKKNDMEAKCGGDMKAKESKCGGEKKAAESKCGAGKMESTKAKEGKCGEAKCGGNK